ncbi:MAG: ZIP family metal transporter [Tissierellaceae bacterium]|nr:ZIP family metal transporter [Tissierellaceae bacterium]
MNNIIYNISIIGGIGFLSAWMGILAGVLLSFFIKGKKDRLKGAVFGLIGSLMIAIVFFELIPESIETSNIYITSIGIISGIIVSIFLDGKLDYNHLHIPMDKNYRFLKSGIFMAIAIGIHHVPMGFALGSLMSTNPAKGIHLAMAVIFHGIPEGLAIGIFFNESNLDVLSLILISIFTSIPLGLSSILGGIISGISPTIISLSLALAGGMIVYIIFNETLPNAWKTWKGRG